MVTPQLALSESSLPMTEELPNLLLFAQTIPQTIHAGEILLYRLLKDYPSDRLLVIGPGTHPDARRLRCRYETIKVPLERFDRTRFGRLTLSLRSSGLFPQISTHAVRERLGKFKPQVVLTIMQSQAYYDAAYHFARSAGLPLVIIAYDIPEAFERVYPWARRMQIRKNTEIYNYALKRLCISPEMNLYLQTIYGETGDVLYPNRSENLVPRSFCESPNLKEPGVLTVGYAGTLTYGYGPQLKRMIPAFRQAGAKLRIYSIGSIGDDDKDIVTSCGRMPLPEMTWDRVKEECDAVILPYSWPDAGHERLYRVHFPSKLSEYLALGMPVIVVGPEYATGVKWATENPKAALVVTENDEVVWTNALSVLKNSPSLRRDLSKDALIAAECFDPARIRGEFLDHICQVGSVQHPSQ